MPLAEVGDKVKKITGFGEMKSKLEHVFLFIIAQIFSAQNLANTYSCAIVQKNRAGEKKYLLQRQQKRPGAVNRESLRLTAGENK